MKAQRVNGSDPAEAVQPLTLRNVRSATRAALTNELMTRARVDALEQAHAHTRYMTEEYDKKFCAFANRKFWRRLRWLVFGI